MKEPLKRKKTLLNSLRQKSKPLFGSNRSHSMQATSRKFKVNRQRFRIGSQVYYLPVKLFRAY